MRTFGTRATKDTGARSLSGLYGILEKMNWFTAIVDALPNKNVYPSGVLRATSAAPMLPLAPARFSAKNVWLDDFVRCSARMRPAMSAAPPGSNGTTMRIGLLGQ